jgi:hypothetical protein
VDDILKIALERNTKRVETRAGETEIQISDDNDSLMQGFGRRVK